MPKFIYAGVTSGSKQVKGEITAGSRKEAISLLSKKKVRVQTIRSAGMDVGMLMSSLPMLGGATVKLEDISRFTRQFAAMTSAGLPLVQCLDILASQTENKLLARTISVISNDIQGGNTLADALAKHPKVFNQLYCNMVAAGEASGNLDGILVRLAEYQEKAQALRRKVKGALSYPIILAVVAVGVLAVMLTFVVPTFAAMFTESGNTLPLPTRIVMGLSDFLRAYIFVIVVALIGAVIAFGAYYRTEQGRYNIDKLKLVLPAVGNLERKSSVSRFSQTLSTLLSSGVTILDALSITAKTAGNAVLEKGLMRTLEKISGGLTIAEPLKETGVFPPMVIHMIAVGEKTGDLSGMLTKVAEFYQEEVDAAVDALTSMLEPLMIVFMGGVIGGVLIAMYMPMFEMMGNIK